MDVSDGKLIPMAGECRMGDRQQSENTPVAQMMAMLKPGKSFDREDAPPALDYSSPINWAAWPGRSDNADLVPENADCVNAQASAQADLFFIYPTTYFGKGNWNQPADNARAREGVSEMVIPGQASAFNGCARIYAPWFRQAALYSFMDPGEDGHQALELAYEDVARAFHYFLEHESKGRPFMIGSHSQGTCHAIRLLEEEVDTRSCRDRFIAGYLVGYHIPMDKFGRTLENLRPSNGPEDIGTVIGWDTVYSGYEDKQAPGVAGHWYPTGWERHAGKALLAVNPLTWTQDESMADASLHHGLLDTGLGRLDMTQFLLDRPMGVKCERLRIIDAISISAQNRNGHLCVKQDQGNQVERYSAPMGSLHNFDYSLFYMNIRENAQLRVRAFLNK